MSPTPGDGVSIGRLLCVSACALGYGLTDAVFITFVMQVLTVVGKSHMYAFMALAVGSAMSIIAAPLATVFSTTINRRASITFGMLFPGAAYCVALSFVVSQNAREIDKPKHHWRVYVSIVLAGLYRAFVQASPIVPCVIDDAQTRGDDENFPVRRDLSLSCFYLLYRVGFVVVTLVIALLSRLTLESVFPIMFTTSMASVLLCGVSTLSFPREEKYVEERAVDIESGLDRIL